jgi:hypothetical protein
VIKVENKDENEPEQKPELPAKAFWNSLPVSIKLVKNTLDSLVMYNAVAPSIFNCLAPRKHHIKICNYNPVRNS